MQKSDIYAKVNYNGIPHDMGYFHDIDLISIIY